MVSVGRTTESQALIHVRAGRVRWLGLHDKPQGVPQGLAEQGTGEFISGRGGSGSLSPHPGTTSRPQCLQTRARARIRSAQ